MICEPCINGLHENCEDKQRHAHYVQWLQSHPFGEDAVIGQGEMIVIKANRPYDSCPCQHKIKPCKHERKTSTLMHPPEANSIRCEDCGEVLQKAWSNLQ